MPHISALVFQDANFDCGLPDTTQTIIVNKVSLFSLSTKASGKGWMVLTYKNVSIDEIWSNEKMLLMTFSDILQQAFIQFGQVNHKFTTAEESPKIPLSWAKAFAISPFMTSICFSSALEQNNIPMIFLRLTCIPYQYL